MVVSEVRQAFEEQMSSSQKERPDQLVRLQQKWGKSSINTVKIICNASWCTRTRSTGIGVVARYDAGAIVEGMN